MIPEIIEGNRLDDHYRMLTKLSLEHLAFLEQQLQKIDAEILLRVERPEFREAFALLQTVPGIKQDGAPLTRFLTIGEQVREDLPQSRVSWFAEISSARGDVLFRH